MKGFYITLIGQQVEHCEKNMLLNKGEASKLVKCTFDIWKARFYHKKVLLVPTLQKDWSK